MSALMTAIQDLFAIIWGNEAFLLMLGLVSVVSFIASLILIPFLVVRIPVDYFAESKRHLLPWAERHIVIRWILLIIKNLLGMIFILLGLMMLVLPGQGMLTLLIGILLLNFPGKYRFERWLIKRPSIYRAVDWLRRRANRESLKID